MLWNYKKRQNKSHLLQKTYFKHIYYYIYLQII